MSQWTTAASIVHQKGNEKTISKRTKRNLFICSDAGARFTASEFIYRSGFNSLSADEYSRGIRAVQWALESQFDFLRDIQDVWLPFEKYLNGLDLSIYPDVIKSSRVTVFLASCVLIVAFYGLVYRVFMSHPVAMLAVTLAAFHLWFVWLSGTSMLEMYSSAGIFAGLYFLVVWLQVKWLRKTRHENGQWTIYRFSQSH